MVDAFRGQVKISDIQDAFDDLVNKINTLIDAYNLAEESAGFTLDDGGSYLAPEGYTLSIGGLKKVLSSYDGAVFGCHAWKVGSKLVISNGIYIKNGAVIKMPQGVVDLDNNKFLYYDTSTSSYVTSQIGLSGDNYIYIRNINEKRNINICDTSSNYAIKDDMKVFCGNNGTDMKTNNYDDSFRPCFVCGTNTTNIGKESWVYFLGQEVAHNWRTTSHNGKEVFPYNHFFLPENISNPFTMSYGTMKSFAYIEK